MDLGEKIKRSRADKGMTQVELAKKASLTERTIQRIENHEVEPSLYSLRKISQVLEVDFNKEKAQIMRRRNRILYVIMTIWTIALIIRLFTTPFDFKSSWWELLIWFFVLIGVSSGQIYIPYRKRQS